MTKHEHTPIADAELDKLQTFPTAALDMKRTLQVLVIEVREARRLLRAVEWHKTRDDCPRCGRWLETLEEGDHCTCELGRYLAACDGKEQS